MGYAYGTAYGYVNMNFAFGYGWYGPPMYYPPYRPYYYGGYYGGVGNGGIGNDINLGDGNRVSHHDGGRNNLYNNRKGVSTMDKKPGQSLNRPTQGAGSRGGPPTVSNQLPNQGGQVRQSRENNNVFADKSGNVYQRDNNGNWSQRNNQNKSWDRTPSNSPSVSAMNRASTDRYRGNARTNNFNTQRNYGGYSGYGGARSYGGGARTFGGGARRR